MTRPTASKRTAEPPIEGGAEILFFTGVRYYRMSEDHPVETKTPRRRRNKPAERQLRLDRQA